LIAQHNHISSSYNSLWPDLPTPVIIGHRGSPVHAPENTLASFDVAIQQGAVVIEFDVKLSADERVVIIHDQTVDRTTTGKGKVALLSLSALKDLDAGSWHSVRFRGEKIPTLEEIFQVFGNNIYFNVELTNYSTPYDNLVKNVVSLVQKYKMEKRILFSSFFPGNLKAVKRLLPDSSCGLLAWPHGLGAWARYFGYKSKVYDAVHPNIKDLSDRLVYSVHASQKTVNVWTVNLPEDMKMMTNMGVDAFFTDNVSKANEILGRSG
jgi:glycerophosphoryl diester phosphodiesterase